MSQGNEYADRAANDGHALDRSVFYPLTVRNTYVHYLETSTEYGNMTGEPPVYLRARVFFCWDWGRELTLRVWWIQVAEK